MMKDFKVLSYTKNVIQNMPTDQLKLATGRLDIYNEELAKTEFLEQFETLLESNSNKTFVISVLTTSFDYIRLGHPLSSILECGVTNLNNLKTENVISFSSRTIPVLLYCKKNYSQHVH